MRASKRNRPISSTLSECPIRAVRDHVPPQVAGVVKAGRTLTAGVRLLSGVSPQVDLQAPVLREALAALHTRVRLLPGVYAHVDGQRGLVDERLAAEGAGDRSLPGVGRPVHDQVLAGEEALATEAAVEGFVGRMQEDALLLGELAHGARMPHVNIGLYCSVQCCRGQLGVSHQSHSALLHPPHRDSVAGTRGEVHQAVVGDLVVRGQRAQSLQLGGREEDVAVLLQRPFSTSMNAHDPQLVMAGGL